MRAGRRYPAPTAVAHRRWSRILTRRGYVGLLWKLLIVAAAVWVLFSQVFLVTQVEGQGMYPAMEDGDLVLVYRLEGSYVKGDVVAYRLGDRTCFGRVAAVETDVVMLDDSGILLVNGTARESGILFPTYPRTGAEYPFVVQTGTLYVLGDHRTQTQDSRDFGPIPLDHIQGKVITLLRRRGL